MYKAKEKLISKKETNSASACVHDIKLLSVISEIN